jgi:hypothetical protein
MGLIFRLVSRDPASLSDFLQKNSAKIHRTEPLPYLSVVARLCADFCEKLKVIPSDQREGRPEALFLPDQDSAPFGVISLEFMTLVFPTHEREKQLLHFPAS